MQKGNGLMSTIKTKNFSYQTYMKENSPDLAMIQRGTIVRKKRFQAALKKSSVHIDEDILEQFEQFVPQGQKCEILINRALREWLSAKDVKDLVRTELQQVLQKTFSSFQTETGTMKIADKKSSYNK